MNLVLNRELVKTQNGWISRCGQLRLAAVGRSEEIADQNLERTIRLFLSPFVREGTLQSELTAAGVDVPDQPLEGLEVSVKRAERAD
jgi:hypothetical protein